MLSAISTMEHNDVADPTSRDPMNSQDCLMKPNGQTESCNQQLIDVDHILCDHGHLDPQKANNMKRISKVSSFLAILFDHNSCHLS
jgi:hypothetical protein